MMNTLHEAKADTNSVLAWLDDCSVETVVACTTPKERVFEHYRAWCSASAMREVSVVHFWKRLKDQVKDLQETRARLSGVQRRLCNISLAASLPMLR